jgi:hypothetical protein
VPVRFDPNIGLMYKEPAEGLRLLIDLPSDPNRYNSLSDAYSQLLKHFRQFKAPPASDRPCGPQEVETVLCKWKSHMNGHYHVGKDIREVRHALAGWGDTADRLLKACPTEVN